MSPATKPRHILHVIETIDPAAGGPSETVRSLFALAPPGYTGEVVTLDHPASPFLATLPFPVHALGKGRTALGYSRPLSRWLRANRSRFDGAMVHGLWRYVSFATWRALRRKKPYIVFPHGMLDPYFKRRFPLKHVQKWLYWLLSDYWVLRDAHRVCFTTAEESRLARQSFWLHRWTPMVTSIGATPPIGSPSAMEQTFFAHCPELRGQRFLLFLGRIHHKKGCDMLVSSFIRHAARDPALHLVLAGPDQHGWSSVLKEMAAIANLKHRVHWPGMITGDAKWGAFFASEAFILPSHQENFGIAVAEALACARPVLLSDRVNIAPEIAQDGAGLIEPDTPEGTDHLLQRWIAMPAEARRTMSQRALQTFTTRYDMRTNAATILRIFDDPHKGHSERSEEPQ